MGEIAFRHEIVCFYDMLNVGTMDADGASHDHVLRAFGDTPIEPQEIRTLEGFEAEAEVEEDKLRDRP